LGSLSASGSIDQAIPYSVTPITSKVVYYAEFASSSGSFPTPTIPVNIQAMGWAEVGGSGAAASGTAFSNNEAWANVRVFGFNLAACAGVNCGPGYPSASFAGVYTVYVAPNSSSSSFGPSVFELQVDTSVGTNSNMTSSYAHAYVDPVITIDPAYALAHPEVTLTFSAQAAGPSGLLNDTGQTLCDNGSGVMDACNASSAGNASALPGQDGRFGRDAASPAKVGGGVAGFDFTKLCMDGTTNCAAAPSNAASPAASDWACTRDNVTNLIWSLQTQNADWNAAIASTYPDAGHNSVSRCGFNSGWRLPTRRELLSLVHRGVSTVPLIDVDYFPATLSEWYWTSDTFAPSPASAWLVQFNSGYPYSDSKSFPYYVRLVRSGS
jgi:hypothetical protein